MKQSETIAKFAQAFVAAQGSVEGAVKGKVNPAFKGTKYADLSSVWDACREAVAANKIGVMQSPGLVIDGKMHMETVLMHESGEWVSGELSIPLQKADAQAYGSAVTYARRYALGAMMGICPEDDDGNAASAPAKQQAPQMLESTRIMLDAIAKCETGKALQDWRKANGDAALDSPDSDHITAEYNNRLAAIKATSLLSAG